MSIIQPYEDTAIVISKLDTKLGCTLKAVLCNKSEPLGQHKERHGKVLYLILGELPLQSSLIGVSCWEPGSGSAIYKLAQSALNFASTELWKFSINVNFYYNSVNVVYW